MILVSLTDQQIGVLLSQGCGAEDWSRVRVSEETDLTRIRNVGFHGDVSIGANSGSTHLAGQALPCGIYNATIADCRIAGHVRIAGVHGLLSGYDIAEGALIQDVGVLVSAAGATFGIGVEVSPVNEAGGRGTLIHSHLTAQTAYLEAMHRHNAAFVAAIRSLAENECARQQVRRGIIGRSARVLGCPSIRDVVIGPFASVEGAAHLANGTVNSSEDHPTTVGNGVHATDFVIAEGARVDSGALLEKVFVGQGVKMGKQFSAENCLFFANCEAFHGEAVSLFAGPYTVSHHKSTLMIAGVFSFYNAGSGTNQSNHMYKLGPVHQGVFERGCKTGSFSYVLYESHIGAFSVIIGKHLANIRTPHLPFSTISERGGESNIVPGMNIFSVGVVRDGDKWPKRDNRKGRIKHDLIVFDVFSPYTVQKMRQGRDELLALHESTPKERATVPIGGMQMSRVLLRKSARYYDSAIVRYLGERILDRLLPALSGGASWTTARAALKPSTDLHAASEWSDLCGLLTPSEKVRELEAMIAGGGISSYAGVLDALEKLFSSYREFQWQYVVEVTQYERGFRPEEATRDQMAELVDAWQKAAQSIQSTILEDARREFSPLSRTGYGLGLSERDADADFAAVRGTLEGNAVVQKLSSDLEAINRRADEARSLIASAP